jgi:hypothetical protein
MVHQPHKFSQAGLPNEIDDPTEPRMPMTLLTTLNELDSPSKMIDYFLKTRRVPPLCRIVVLAAGDNDPKPLWNPMLCARNSGVFLFGR